MATRPSKGAYSRVSTSGTSPTTNVSKKTKLSREERRKKRAERTEYYSTKLQAVGWILGACFALYISNLIGVVRRSTKVNRFWFNIGVILMTISAVLVVYMAIYVPKVLKVKYEPQVYSPKLLPLTGGVTIGSGICFIIGLWPVYGLLTPGLLFVIWVGALMMAHFLPAI